jgi:hypothetical protein
MKNKAWFFGDSFTYGHGCKPGFEYYDKYPDIRESTWTDIISDRLNKEQINEGAPGNATPFILKQVIENLANFSEGDFVFITDALPIRLVYPSKETGSIVPLTTDIILWPERNKNNQHVINRYLHTKEQRRVVLDFIHQSILKYDEYWIDYYMNQFLDIQKHLLSLGVNTYTWSHKIWVSPSPFECITAATNGEVYDGHWSWLGHKQFANYMLSRINNKEYIHKPTLI